jgi:hypothetical protein
MRHDAQDTQAHREAIDDE